MHENLIYEGNTIYELDPECLREKEKQEREHQSGSGRKGKEEGKRYDKRQKTGRSIRQKK